MTPRRVGFTLVELLVVIGLIGLLSAGLGLALGGRPEGSLLRSGEATAAGLFQAARAEAILRQTKTRLVVCEDPDHPERHGRQLGIVAEDPNSAGSWNAVNAGLSLPRGISFWSEQSIDDGQFRLPYPVGNAQVEGTGPPWRFYEFTAQGHLSSGSLRIFALGLGRPGMAVSDRLLESDNARIGGFAISPLGALAFPEDPEALR